MSERKTTAGVMKRKTLLEKKQGHRRLDRYEKSDLIDSLVESHLRAHDEIDRLRRLGTSPQGFAEGFAEGFAAGASEDPEGLA